MLDGTGKQLLDLLSDSTPSRLDLRQARRDAKAAVATAEASLQGLLALEGLCDATTLKTPTGRKRRRDRGKKRAGKNGGEATTEPEVNEIAEAAGEVT